MKPIIALVGVAMLSCLMTGCNRGTGEEMTSSGNSVVSNVESGIESTVSGIESDMTGATAKITEQAAKDAALDAAGLSESEVTGLRAELETDDGKLQYEVHFTANGSEYDYEIDAESGAVLSSDKEQN